VATQGQRLPGGARARINPLPSGPKPDGKAMCKGNPGVEGIFELVRFREERLVKSSGHNPEYFRQVTPGCCTGLAPEPRFLQATLDLGLSCLNT